MTEAESKTLAEQLRKPEGSAGVEVANFMNKGNELLNRNTINLIEPSTNLQIVEVGMGNGKFIEELLIKFPDCHYTGCDYSADMVQAAELLNANFIEQGRVSFDHCDASQLPFLNETIDVIFTVNTIYFWSDVAQMLQEYLRVLKPNGQLLIGLRPAHLMKNYPFIQYGFNLFTEKKVEEYLALQGFESIQSATIQEPDFKTEEFIMPVESLIVTARKK